MKTLQRSTSGTGVRTPAAPFVPVIDDRLAEIHRRAGIAAILRDDRLEISIDEDGGVRARRIPGATV